MSVSDVPRRGRHRRATASQPTVWQLAGGEPGRRPAIGYARYVGRVGALAVALGIGTAVATAPGIASADGESGSGGGTSSEGPSHEAGSTNASATSASNADQGAGAVQQPATVSGGSTAGATASGATSDVKDQDPRSGVVQSTGGALTGTYGSASAHHGSETGASDAESTADTTVKPVSTAPAEQVTEPVRPKSERLNATSSDSVGSDAAPSVPRAPVRVTPTVTAQSTTASPQEESDSAPALPETVSAPAPVLRVAKLAAPAETPDVAASRDVVDAAPAPSLLAAPVALLSTVFNSVLGAIGLVPAAGSDPAAPPADSPTLLGLLAYARREIQRQLFNSAPTTAYDSAENVESADGTITGDLHATDADGDPLVYRVTQDPSHGTIVIHDDGSFTYTPDKDYATAGGADSFTVTVSDDDGVHTHGLFSFLAPGGGHTATAPVTLTVAPVLTDGAPVVDPDKFTQVAGDPKTGVVTGSLGVADPNGDPLTYTIVDGPKGGSLAIDPVTGTYTYTPTTAARLKAGLATPETAPAARAFAAAEAAPDYTHDGFTYTVSDGVNDPQTVSVSGLNVAPLYVNVGQPTHYDGGTMPAAVVAGPGDTAYFMDVQQSTIYRVNADGSVQPVVSGLPAGLTGSYAVSPDGTKLYVPIFSEDGRTFANTVRVVDTSNGDVLKNITVPDGPEVVTVSDNGRAFVFSQSYDVTGNQVAYHRALTEIDTATDTVVGSVPSPDDLFILQMKTDSTGSRLFYSGYTMGSGSGPATMTSGVLDTATGAVSPIDFGSGQATPIAIGYLSLTRDEKQLFYPRPVADANGRITGIQLVVVDNDPASATYLQAVDVIDKDNLDGYTPAPISVGSTPDGSVLYVPGGVLNENGGADELDLLIIDARDHSLITAIPLNTTTATGFAFSADGTRGYLTDAGPNLSGPGSVSVITISPTKPTTDL